MPGEFPGYGPKMKMFCQYKPIQGKVLHHAVEKAVEKALLITKLLRMVWSSCFLGMFCYHSLFMTVYLGKNVSEPTPLAEKQPHT